MQIVIDIDEEDYTNIKNAINSLIEKGVERASMSRVCLAILDGVIIPSGHGRLIDADALEKRMCNREEELGDDRAMWESSAVSVALDMFAPTIIEADKPKNSCSACPRSGSIIDGYKDCPDAYTKQSQYCGFNNKE